MNKLNIDVETEMPPSQCCECGYKVNGASGPCKPEPGDLTLCIQCACLNVFNTDLSLRKPTDEEIFAAAVNPDLQQLRKMIESIPKRVK